MNKSNPKGTIKEEELDHLLAREECHSYYDGMVSFTPNCKHYGKLNPVDRE